MGLSDMNIDQPVKTSVHNLLWLFQSVTITLMILSYAAGCVRALGPHMKPEQTATDLLPSVASKKRLWQKSQPCLDR